MKIPVFCHTLQRTFQRCIALQNAVLHYNMLYHTTSYHNSTEIYCTTFYPLHHTATRLIDCESHRDWVVQCSRTLPETDSGPACPTSSGAEEMVKACVAPSRCTFARGSYCTCSTKIQHLENCTVAAHMHSRPMHVWILPDDPNSGRAVPPSNSAETCMMMMTNVRR